MHMLKCLEIFKICLQPSYKYLVVVRNAWSVTFARNYLSLAKKKINEEAHFFFLYWKFYFLITI